MFTGLVEAIGTVYDVQRTGSVLRISVDCPVLAADLIYGQSVAVSGACLTVVSIRESRRVFDVEMMPETAMRTRFRALSRGNRVNLERAMQLGGRLDGHLVLGHVDGTATLEKFSGSDRTRTALFRAPRDLTRYIVAKGSVAIDGVSLTVIDAEPESFSVGLIPATLENCTLGQLVPGEIVNIETDIIGKYVERLLTPKVSEDRGKSGGLTIEELSNLGY